MKVVLFLIWSPPRYYLKLANSVYLFQCFKSLHFQTSRVVVESGMRLSALSRILESVHLSLDLYGKVPDLTICDAIAAGNTASILGTGTD